MKHLHFPFSDPFSHAAAEEVLFRSPDSAEEYFLTYINGPSVHIGRHQAKNCECDAAFCEEKHLPILRRISGGGAVYHDQGVLNYAFAVSRNALPPEQYVSLIVRGLNKMLHAGICRCSRCSLWLDGCKISGTAFAMTGRRLLVHGCLLLHADLDMLERALSSPLPEPDFRPAVRSVHSPVMNLSRIRPDITPGKTAVFLHRFISQEFSGRHEWISWSQLDFRAFEQKFQDQERLNQR